MHTKLILLICSIACVFGAPPTDVVPLEKQQPTVIPIVSQSEELEPNGTYKFSYETGNGIKREEIAYEKVVPKAESRSASSNEGGENSESEESNEIHVQQGSYSYTAPDGTVISVRYIADENGFQPVGDHIPQAIQASYGSHEKSGRALDLDSTVSASEPVAAKKEEKPVAPVVVASPASEPESKPDAPVAESAPAQAPEPATSPAAADLPSARAAPVAPTTLAAEPAPELDSSAASTTSPEESTAKVSEENPETPAPVLPESSPKEETVTLASEQSSTAAAETQPEATESSVSTTSASLESISADATSAAENLSTNVQQSTTEAESSLTTVAA